MMRILMLSWEFPPHVVGGLGKHVADLVPALADQGIEVHLVTPNMRGGPAQETIAPNATVYRVPTPDMTHDGNGFVTFTQTSNSSLELKGRQLYEQLGGFDLVHAHDWLVAYSSVALKYAARVPLVATIHATERGRGYGRLESEQARAINGTEWWLTYEAWHVITVSKFMAAQVNDYFEVPCDKLSLIYNGVHLPSAPRLSTSERQHFRRRFARDEQRIVFYVGRVVQEKGIQVLIDAASNVLQACPDTHFVIAGTGAQLDQLRHYAWAKGVGDAFTFTGFVADMERDHLFQVADVAVFPSLYEPFGIVALEAMSYHCPVVVSATGGLKEVVKLHETGITAHPGNADSLAWAITHTLQHPQWASTRAENAFREVETLYNWTHIARQTIEVYEQVRTGWRSSAWGRSHERSIR